MRRRGLLLLAALGMVPVRADTRQELVDLFGRMAGALANAEGDLFLESFDPAWTGLAGLRDQIAALLAVAEVSSSVDLVRHEGDEKRQRVELDWALRVQVRAPGGPVERRRERVRAELVRQGKRWRVARWEAGALFAPPVV